MPCHKVKKCGIDIFMTTTVLKRGYSMVEVELPPKIHSPNLPKIKNMLPEVRVALVSVFFLVLNLQNILPVTRSDPLAKCYVNVNVMSPKINYLCPKGFLKLGGG